MTNTQVSRRTVLKAAAAVSPLFISSSVLGRPVPSANDRVNVGIIGLGGRCRTIAQDCLGIPEMRIVAVCDCFQPHIDAFQKSVGKDQNWKTYTDFRQMIENENLDAVMVETTTHARAWVVCHAMAAGMDAYIEKPMALTIAEGRHMVRVARKYGRVTQVGTQQRSIPLNNWASDLVKNGAIGKIKTVLAPNFVGPVPWTLQPEQPLPEGGSDSWWDTWTNQAPLRPYHRQLHYGWPSWDGYDGGGRCFGVTGWGAHSYDQIQRGLGTDETGPVEIVLEEPSIEMSCGKFDPRKPTDDETGAQYYGMTQEVIGPRGKIRMRYANGTELQLQLDGDWGPGLGCIFIGENGKIEINRDKIAANPAELLKSPDNPGPLTVSENEPHIRNWIERIKDRGRCHADIEYGQRSSTLCYLVNIARQVGQVGKSLKWDPVAERFTNCDEGNLLLSRERRNGYELPT
ncbi:MAG TPA: Gfo/Idh/MocA family oxidoreductase [Planctomycetaceae bacterium]|nr:Gfo/Idh/MocA family oxidoreductase [Planctomycetaceae bacterium]HRA89583.1 Gfo/Idh/MocA family oxidoreductase [Planctomycetaceae bacterium]